jgi:TPR repeat protein
MQNAEKLCYQSVQLYLRAERAAGEAKADLQRQYIDMLHRVVEVDPHHIDAQHNLGVIYKRGEGVEKDAVQAVHWYRKAAEKGYAQAQCCIGCMYLDGEGVNKDAVQAAHWYRKAADQGHAGAQNNLGGMYGNGVGVHQNDREAARWWRMAAAQREANAHYCLGQLAEHQGEYQAAMAHYRAGQAAFGPEEARACIRRWVGAVVRAKQEEQKEQEERKGE